jgi:hypothetical protein
MKPFIPLMCLTLLAATRAAFPYSDNLIVFDDAAENGFTTCLTQPPVEPEITVVHSGSVAMQVPNTAADNLYFCGPVYSLISDYDGISFWINGGTSGGETIYLLISDDTDFQNDPLLVELATLYGGPLPSNQWVHIQGVFSEPPFSRAYDNPFAPPTFNRLTFEIESSGAGLYYIDDVVLTAADIFKNGFGQSCTDPSLPCN